MSLFHQVIRIRHVSETMHSLRTRQHVCTGTGQGHVLGSHIWVVATVPDTQTWAGWLRCLEPGMSGPWSSPAVHEDTGFEALTHRGQGLARGDTVKEQIRGSVTVGKFGEGCAVLRYVGKQPSWWRREQEGPTPGSGTGRAG